MRSVEPWNTFVEGDNLDVLPRLAASGERYDVVYLDPPYNTGNPFAYNDKVAGPRGRPAPRLGGDDAAAARGRARGDDRARRRLRQHRRPRGRPPAAAPRRRLRRGLLPRPDRGQPQPQGPPARRWFATSHEYLLVYARSAPALRARPVEPVDRRPARLPADRGRRAPLPAAPAAQHQQEVQPGHGADPALRDLRRRPTPAGSRPSRSTARSRSSRSSATARPPVWRWSAARIDERPDDLVCRWVGGRWGGRADVFQKDWLHEGRRKKLRTIWLASEIGSTDTAVAELKALVGHLFESPKPTGLLRRILETMPDDARVLDPFAGSGTTGHAVALQNAADGGRRTCVSVNAPEPVRPGSNADLAGYQPRQRRDPGRGCGQSRTWSEEASSRWRPPIQFLDSFKKAGQDRERADPRRTAAPARCRTAGDPAALGGAGVGLRLATRRHGLAHRRGPRHAARGVPPGRLRLAAGAHRRRASSAGSSRPGPWPATRRVSATTTTTSSAAPAAPSSTSTAPSVRCPA